MQKPMEERGENDRKHVVKNESAGKCDNNQRKWCKNDRKMKETGKTLGKIH